MDLNQVHKIFFLGIGGIGMSALARYFNKQGKEIFGFDNTATPLTDELITEGMTIRFDENTDSLPPQIDLIIYTPAIPKYNRLYEHFRYSDTPLLKRSQVLGMLSEKTFTIAIAGTHGKTSISALSAHMLKSSGVPITALIGGICKNYNTNVILSENSKYLLIEADEFDRSFLTLKPDIAVISSMDADHLDIYENKNSLVDSFIKFTKLIKPEGLCICQNKLKKALPESSRTIYYGIDSQAGISAQNIRIMEGAFMFDFRAPEMTINDVKMYVPGKHYIENATAAMAIGYALGLNAEQLKKGIESFKGVLRRFEVRHKNNPVFIDDYAHHPEEINATVEAIRMLYPGRKITAVFQPHLYSRTRDFADEFAVSLSKFDDIVLLDIYPAREKPIDGITSSVILNKIENSNKRILSKAEALRYVETIKTDILLTIGAGDIGFLADKIEQIVKRS